MKRLLISLLTVLLVMVSDAITAQCISIIYVKHDAPGSNDGSSWQDAHHTIQAALDQAELCPNTREIWVAEGTYTPTVDVTGSTSTGITANRTLVIDFDVRLYGGFGGFETLRRERVKHLFPTIISGDHSGNDIYNDNLFSSSFPAANTGDNSYNIMRLKNLSSNTIIDGFTFQGGDADHPSTLSKRIGAAIFNDGRGTNNQSNPIISNCIFRYNRATLGGGAIYNYGEDSEASPSIERCEFKYNFAIFTGGGAVLNFAKKNGARSSPIIKSCLFASNRAGQVNSVGNDEIGGAILNVSEDFGRAEPYIRSCTIVDNISDYGGGVGSDNNSKIPFNPIVTNIVSTIMSNSAKNDGDDVHTFTSNMDISYSIFSQTSTYNGIGNMDVDPLWLGQDNYRLSSQSPAIDNGSPQAPAFGGPSTYDLDDNARKINSTEDIGAYEYLQCPSTNTIYVNASQSSNAPNGSSELSAINSLSMALAMSKSCSGTPELIVSTGTYVPHRTQELLPLEGDARTSAVFKINRSITISGGHPASFFTPPGPTMLTGDIYRNDNGSANREDNILTIVEVEGNVNKLHVENITIQNGNNVLGANNKASAFHVGDLTSASLELDVVDCEIKNNHSVGIKVGNVDIDLSRGDFDLDARFTHTIFSNNKATDGAALNIYNQDSEASLVMDTCSIRGNQTWGVRAPLSFTTFSSQDDNVVIRHADVQENYGALFGGGMYFKIDTQATATVTISDSDINDNEANNGGGLFFFGSQLANLNVSRTRIWVNEATDLGGGMYVDRGKMYMDNCLLNGNDVVSTVGRGGAMFLRDDTDVTSINNSFVNNSSRSTEHPGGAIYAHSTTTASFVNTVFWDNKSGDDINSFSFNDTLKRPYVLDYTLIEESTCPTFMTCTNMIYAQDPQFIFETDVGRYVPGFGSPLLNAADLSQLPGGNTDVRGGSRIVNYGLDIGAVEAQRACDDNLFLNISPVYPNLIGGWTSSNLLTVGSGNSTSSPGWLRLDSPEVVFNNNYELESDGTILEVFVDGCGNN